MTTVPNITLKALDWIPYLPPVEVADATPEQLSAMQVTPSATKVSPYVRTLVHDPESYVARTTLFNAIMYAEGGAERADRELGALGASLVNGCRFCANVHARRHQQLTDGRTVSALFAGMPEALPARDRAIVAFAEALTATPPKATPAHIEALRESGMTTEEIEDIIHSIAIFGWANRLMHPLGKAK